MPSAYYAVCPGTGGTDDKKTGSPTITIASGVATLSVAQTGNIGQGFRITYDTSKVCFISNVNSSTSFNVVTATGGTPSNEASAVTVNSIRADYASLSAAEAGASDSAHLNTSNLTTGSHILNLVCYAGAADGSFVLSGFDTDDDNYVKIYVPPAHRHSGKFDNEKYRIQSTDWFITRSTLDKAVFDGLQIIDGSSNPRTFIWGAGTLLIAKDCIVVREYPGALGSAGIFGAVQAENCIAIGFITKSGTSGNGFFLNDTEGLYAYNCIAYGGYLGIMVGGNLPILKNCAAFGSTDADISSYSTHNAASDYNASGNTTPPGSHSVDLSSYTAAQIWTDADNGDFSLVSNSPLINAGIGPAQDSNVPTTDIAGTSRSGDTCDIGAFEYVASGSISGSCDESFTFVGTLTKTAVLGATALESVLLTDPTEKLATFFSTADVNATISAITAALKSINATASVQTNIGTNATSLKEVATIMETFVSLQDVLNKTATAQGTLETNVQISTSSTATAALIAAILQTLILTGVAETEATSLIVSVCDETFTLGNVSIADATKIATLITSFSTSATTQAIAELNAALQATISLASDINYGNIVAGILEQFLSYTVNSVATGEMLSNAQDNITITTLINNISTLLTVITDNIVFSDAANWAGIITAILSEYIDITTATEVARLITSIGTQNITVNTETNTNVTFNIALADNIAISDAMLIVKTVASVCADMFNIDNVSFWMEATGKVTISFTLAKSNITFTLTKGNVSINLI